MEFLNKVELKGVVGSVSTTKVADTTQARFSVSTTYASKDQHGNEVYETNWFNCVAYESKTPACTTIKNYDNVHVVGRMKARRYTAEDGAERMIYEVVADSVTTLNK